MLKRESPIFQDMLSLPQPSASTDIPEGSTDSKPIILSGITVDDFRQLLESLYPLFQHDRRTPTLAFPPVLVPAAAVLIATGTSSHNPSTTNPGNTLERAIHCVRVVGEAGFGGGGRCESGYERRGMGRH
ncbi:hypothetical protein M422DRAFT_247305 [Sphaerobolus stellatus SS14]|nr:hypothetical protein M422DRAFT_247305 [Sphaerobolus stellatus SS14]